MSDTNSGDRNSGDSNSGYFNSDSPFVRMFGKDTGIRFEDWDIEFPEYMYFDLSKWVREDDMTKEEKKGNPSYKTTGGYLKVKGYRDAWREAWEGAGDEEKVDTIELLNFDADIFFSITGIDVRVEKFEGNTHYNKTEADELVDLGDGKKYSKSTLREMAKRYSK